MMTAWLLIAQDNPAPVQQQGGPPPWSSMVIFLPILILFFVMIILPGRKQRQEQEKMMSSLSRNDKVLTSFGLIGWIISVNSDQTVTLKTDNHGSDGAKIHMKKEAIIKVLDSGENVKQS